MIPINEIVPENLYSQADAPFLLGEAFSRKSAREHIARACRTGELRAAKLFGKWWFTGAEFVRWTKANMHSNSLELLRASEPSSSSDGGPGSARKEVSR